MTTPVSPTQVVSLVLYAPATRLVPKAGLPQGEVAFLQQWTPGAVVQAVPTAAAQALTPQAIVAQLTPAALAQNWTQSLAMAAVLAAFA
jgi:hypothetical protein